jgi:hypothetical protein
MLRQHQHGGRELKFLWLFLLEMDDSHLLGCCMANQSFSIAFVVSLPSA